jgi:hypothetical protein
LVEVCGPVFDYLHCNDLLSLQILALHDLTKGALSEDIEDEVPIPEESVSTPYHEDKRYVDLETYL